MSGVIPIVTRHLPGHPAHPAARAAFTLIELMIALVVVAILAVVVVPAMAPEDAVKVVSASHLLASDLEYAQSGSLSDPSDPIVIVFDDEAPRYWLARASDPETPIERPGSGGAYVIEMGIEPARQLEGVRFEPGNVENATIAYDAFGRLDQLDDAFVRVYNHTGEIYVSVSAATGSVSVVNTPPPSAQDADEGGKEQAKAR